MLGLFERDITGAVAIYRNIFECFKRAIAEEKVGRKDAYPNQSREQVLNNQEEVLQGIQGWMVHQKMVVKDSITSATKR